MTIRAYTAADRAACLRIFESNLPLYFDPSEREQLGNWLLARDEKRLAYAGNLAECFYVLELDGCVLACGGYYIPEPEPRAVMVWGMVQQEHHKQGLGRALLHYRVRQVMEMHAGLAIWLDTTQHTFPFFERLGFAVTAITDNYYGPGLQRYDMVLEKGSEIAL